MTGIFFDLTILLVGAAMLGIVMHALRLPTILGYLLTGFLAASFGVIGPLNQDVFKPLADIGVALLLFLVGLEMNIRDLRELGTPILLLGSAQVAVTGVIGFFIGTLMGLDPLASLYLALALTFSSTIIVIRLLSQKQNLGSLYGKVSVGILLVQDIVAILALVLLSGFNQTTGQAPDLVNFILTGGKAVLLVGNVVILSQSVIPYLVHRIARSPELLFVTSIAWAFGVAAFTSSELIGFSIEIGGFLAGLALANSLEHIQIAGRIRYLRDFFIVLFFVFLGSRIDLGGTTIHWGIAALLTLFVLLGKPFLVLSLMGLQGFRKHTSFLTGVTQTQISEFSLLLLALGLRLGHLTDTLVATVTLVGVVTMTVSTTLILYEEAMYRKLKQYLGIFERKVLSERFAHVSAELKDHVVLVGSHRTGHNILHALRRGKVPFVVVDFDPQVIDALADKKVNVIFGDISDEEIQERARLKQARLVISTITDREDTLRLLVVFSRLKQRPQTIVTAVDPSDAQEFYSKGADYVLLPHFVSGEHVADLIASPVLSRRLHALRQEHRKLLLDARHAL